LIVPGFTISVSPTTLTMLQGDTKQLTVTGVPFGSYPYAGGTSVLCEGLPAGASCTYYANSPVYFDGSGSTTSGPLIVTTTGPNLPGSVKTGGLIWLPAMLLAGLLVAGRKKLTMRGRQLLVLAILLCGTMAVSGCGKSFVGSPSGNWTPTGTYNITVVATGSGATPAYPNAQATANFTLIVQ
jgi:hypothetical protein